MKGQDEIFALEPLSEGRYAITCLGNHQYLSAEKGGGARIIGNKSSVDTWEEWQISEVANAPGYYHIIGPKGDYWSADKGGGGSVMCNRKKAGRWEEFIVAPAQRRLSGSVSCLDLLELITSRRSNVEPQNVYFREQQPYYQQHHVAYPQQLQPYQQAHQPPCSPQYMQHPRPTYSNTTNAMQQSPTLDRSGSPQYQPPQSLQHSPSVKPKQNSGSRSSSGSLRPSASSIRLDDDLISFSDSDPPDLTKAKACLQDYLQNVKLLEDIFVSLLRPGIGGKSKSKILTMQGLKGSRGNVNALRIDKETKSEIFRLSELLMRQFEVFMFDWTRYGKQTGERSFSCIALLLGSFKDHLKQMVDSVNPTEPICETLSCLSTKFSKIQVSFDQSFDYHNSRSVQAELDTSDTVTGPTSATYEFESDPVQRESGEEW